MTNYAYVWSLGASSCLEKGVIYIPSLYDKTRQSNRKETIKQTLSRLRQALEAPGLLFY